MEIEVGAVVTGKVTGITKFGAFVNLAPGKSGLVHISEIANTYVNDIHDHLTDGQEVKVKVISIDESGRINLSIKQAERPAQPQQARPRAPQQQRFQPRGNFTPRQQNRSQTPAPEPQAQTAEASFEDKLKRFMQDSDSKISGIKQYAEKKSARRRSR